MFRAILIMTAALSILSLSTYASATEGFARQTGWGCAVCHANQLGGGELTASGDAFKSALVSAGTYRPLGPVRKVVRLIVGYLHILAGVVWFGAIFYVHILLKPAYASKGLPKGELILGWAGIITTGVTGAFLTFARMPSLGAFFTTRFGILLSVKIALYLMMALSAALVTFVLGPKMRKKMQARAAEGDVLMPETLKNFDGREGRPAYVLVDGAVYDVTASKLWKNGKHGRHLAGEDLTAALAQAPHGPEKLGAFPHVGALAARPARPAPDRPKAIFYLFAYMNLALVFLILGIVALWRWW